MSNSLKMRTVLWFLKQYKYLIAEIGTQTQEMLDLNESLDFFTETCCFSLGHVMYSKCMLPLISIGNPYCLIALRAQHRHANTDPLFSEFSGSLKSSRRMTDRFQIPWIQNLLNVGSDSCSTFGLAAHEKVSKGDDYIIIQIYKTFPI